MYETITKFSNNYNSSPLKYYQISTNLQNELQINIIDLDKNNEKIHDKQSTIYDFLGVK